MKNMLNFVNSLQNYLNEELDFKKTKLNFSKAKETKHICTMEYSGRGQIKNYMTLCIQMLLFLAIGKKQNLKILIVLLMRNHQVRQG